MTTMFIAFDTETTGIEAGSRILELSAMCFDDTGTVIDIFDQLINPDMKIPPDVSLVHGLNNADINDQLPTKVVLTNFFNWLPEKCHLVAHNAPYDLGILHWECERVGLPLPDLSVIDTLRMAREAAPGISHSLSSMAKHFEFDMMGDAHRALPDADMVRQIFLAMRNKNISHDPISWSPCYHYTDSLPQALTELPSHIKEGTALSFSYTNKQGDSYFRKITPYGWVQKNDRILLHGLCHYSGERRSFYADKMNLV